MITPEDNWLPSWNELELLAYQQQDPDLSKAAVMTEKKTWSTSTPYSDSHTLQSLWAQREHLVVCRHLLYRQWIDASEGVRAHVCSLCFLGSLFHRY